jgi:hypothetical protein
MLISFIAAEIRGQVVILVRFSCIPGSPMLFAAPLIINHLPGNLDHGAAYH